MDVDEVAGMAGLELFPYQRKYLESIQGLSLPQRTCLYYRTGAGKTFTSLAGVKLWGYGDCVVIAPPSTHRQWQELAWRLDMDVDCMSHAKFRMRDTRLSRRQAVIADEFHMFGGQKGQGWRKLDALARHLEAPMVLMSATPNYNDAERVYCVSRILDPHSAKGGYLQFLYTHCLTEQNMFGVEPKVNGFRNHKDAAEFLASLPNVYHLPDERVVDIVDIGYFPDLPLELELYGYDRRNHRMMASRMEAKHVARVRGLVGTDGRLRPEVFDRMHHVLNRPGGVLVFASHATVAAAMSSTFHHHGVGHGLITGSTPKQRKEEVLDWILCGRVQILIGTAALATGTDGLDKVCDTLLILDDTDDEALRRQLVGRILPRGMEAPIATKGVFRMVPS